LIRKELKQQLDKIIKETGTTLYMVLLAVYNILLSRYSGQEDIIIGTPVAGRENVDFENIIGVFINVLPMRNFPDGEKTFLTFLKEVKKNTLNAFENQSYPFGQLINKITIEKDLSRNPLYDAELIVQNYEVPKLKIDKLKFTPYARDSNQTQVDLGLVAIELGEIITIDLNYCTKLYRRDTMEEFVRNFHEILSIILEDKNINIKDIKISHHLGAAKRLIDMDKEGDFVF
jgi:non-ribosomal peptide synthetase component F